MKAILVNYQYDPTWLKDYPTLEPIIYDRSDDGVERDLTKYGQVIRTPNVGDVDYDKLTWLIENYNNLPDLFLWGKTNIFKYVDKDTLDAAFKANKPTPLIRPDHKIYADQFGQVNKWDGRWYWERADSWFFNATQPKYFFTWDAWCDYLNLPKRPYIHFAPGGNYILSREQVQGFSKDFYEKMRDVLPHSQRPAEAQACERTYGYLWN